VQIIKNKLCCSNADIIKNVRTADDTKIADGGGYEEWLAAFSAATGSTNGSEVADPEFADGSSFELGAASPALDAIDCFAPTDRVGTARRRDPSATLARGRYRAGRCYELQRRTTPSPA
jgi:hypothetical protein